MWFLVVWVMHGYWYNNEDQTVYAECDTALLDLVMHFAPLHMLYRETKYWEAHPTFSMLQCLGLV